MDKASPSPMWDPFRGPVPFHQDSVQRPAKGMKVPGFVRSLGGILLLGGLLLCVVAIVYRDALWLGLPGLCIGMLIIFAIDHVTKVDDQIDWLLHQVAKRNNWAFECLRQVKAEVLPDIGLPLHDAKSVERDNRHLAEMRVRDPRVRQVHARVGDLLKPKVGRVTMVDFNAVFRGQSRASVPFWMMMSMVQSDMTLAAAPFKQDAYGQQGHHAYMLQMICAYQLDRDTGIRARLLHESVTGESRKDFQTESVDFNRLFNISLADVAGNLPEDADMQHQALLQALTPATQATLIDLKTQYDVQVVIEGDTVFYAGWDRLNTMDFDIISQHIHAITEAFAESAMSFKRYVE